MAHKSIVSCHTITGVRNMYRTPEHLSLLVERDTWYMSTKRRPPGGAKHQLHAVFLFSPLLKDPGTAAKTTWSAGLSAVYSINSVSAQQYESSRCCMSLRAQYNCF